MPSVEDIKAIHEVIKDIHTPVPDFIGWVNTSLLSNSTSKNYALYPYNEPNTPSTELLVPSKNEGTVRLCSHGEKWGMWTW